MSTRVWHRIAVTLAVGFAFAALARASDWPLPVKNFTPPAPGEHPRLFFRESDLPAIRKRAQTPEGRAIVRRLRLLLDGADGTRLPPMSGTPTSAPDRKSKDEDSDPAETGSDLGKAYTLWHGAGYGMLYQLTGDKAYADLGKACVAKALVFRVTDMDPRYSFSKATGPLRNGPALGAVAMAYDLCYGGWDEPFRETVRKAIEFYDPSKELSVAKPSNCTLDDLARGSRHNPASNHWGPQIGGAALALLAIARDPGVDQTRIDTLLETNRQCIARQLSEGQGDHGYYHQHPGAGQIATDTALVPALQAWRVAGGLDFSAGRPEVPWLTLRWSMWLVPTPRGPEYPNPVRKNSYGGEMFTRGGLSRGGQFAQGFGVLPAEWHPAILWTYENVIRPTESRDCRLAGLAPGEASFDTIGPYPHRAILALVNWPFDTKPENPGLRLPRQVSDERLQFHFFRNRWKDDDDILVSALLDAEDGSFFSKTGRRLRVWGLGRRFNASFPRPGEPGEITAYGTNAWTLAWSNACITVDFRIADSADAVILANGLDVTPDLPPCLPGTPAGGMNLTGSWRTSYGVEFECRGTGVSNLFDRIERKGTISGKTVSLTIGGNTRDGTLSADGDTITWKDRQVWTRVIALPTSGPLEPADKEPSDGLDAKLLDGEWKTDLLDRPVLTMVQKGSQVLFPPAPIGHLEMTRATSAAYRLSLPQGRSAAAAGVVSTCGDIIDWNGQDEWRRIGSPALEPARYGDAHDPRSRRAVVDCSGTKVTAIVFSSSGSFPDVQTTAAGLQIGSRTYRKEGRRLVPD